MVTRRARLCLSSLRHLVVLPARSVRRWARRLRATRRLGGWLVLLLLLVAFSGALLSASILDGEASRPSPSAAQSRARPDQRAADGAGTDDESVPVPTKAATVVAEIGEPARNFSRPPGSVAVGAARTTSSLTRMKTVPLNATNILNMTRSNISANWNTSIQTNASKKHAIPKSIRTTSLTRMKTVPLNATNILNMTKSNISANWNTSIPTNASKKHAISKSIRHFALMYAPVYPRKRKAFFDRIRSIAVQEWRHNVSNALQFRRDVRAVVGKDGGTDNMYLTKLNTAPKARLTYYISGKRKVLSNVLWRTLPKKSAFDQGKFKTCSVVGSSGILSNSKCGELIDNADFVVRFNLAPVKGYETDVGSKTNFTTVNPSFIQKNMDPYKNTTNARRLARTLAQFRGGLLFLPAFGVVQATRVLERTSRAAASSGLMRPVYGSPNHFVAVTKLWKVPLKFSKRRRLSTGLYVTSSLFDLCDRLNLYGFWPYATSADGMRNISYHYHDKIKGKRFHDFNREFQALLSLHERGVLRVQLGPCRETR